MAGGYAGPGEPQSPYPEYQARHPQGAPGGYPGPYGYGERINGGDYAYVIRADDLVTPSPSRPHTRERGQGMGGWSPANAGSAPGHTAGSGAMAPSGKSSDGAGTPTAAVRAITAGAADTQWPANANGPSETSATVAGKAATSSAAASAEAVVTTGTALPASAGGKARAESDADPALAYGRDDPAYGPPGPDWYKRDEDRTPWAEDGDSHKDEDEARPARGPFEPLRPGERDATGYADHWPADDEPTFDSHDADLPDIPGYQPLDYEMPELLDFGTPSDPEAGALGQIRDLYLTAETIGPAGLDSHFDQLLERQRQLISEYFKESGGVGSAEPTLPATPATPAAAPTPATPLDPSASAVPLGFDTAESLAGLGSELRSAP